MTYQRIKDIFRVQVYITELPNDRIVFCVDCDKTKKFASLEVFKYECFVKSEQLKHEIINGQISYYIRELLDEVWVLKILGDIEYDFNYTEHKEFDSIRQLLSTPQKRSYGFSKYKDL